MKTRLWMLLLALAAPAFAETGLDRAAKLSEAASRARNPQESALLASAAVEGRVAGLARTAVSGGVSRGPAALPAPCAGAREDVSVPSPTSFLIRPRPRGEKKAGFWHRLSRTTFGELVVIGLIGFIIAAGGMVGGAYLGAALVRGGGAIGGFLGMIPGFYLGAKAVEALDK